MIYHCHLSFFHAFFSDSLFAIQNMTYWYRDQASLEILGEVTSPYN